MNKDVVYIEPEEDITDIITKIENSKSKIVALVPPKKAGVFRSIVNIKLITKAGASSRKTVVLVTTDPSIIKLAAATKMPVTKDLQTAPKIPDADTDIDETEVVDVEDDAEEVEEDKKAEKDDGSDDKEESDDDFDGDSEEESEDDSEGSADEDSDKDDEREEKTEKKSVKKEEVEDKDSDDSEDGEEKKDEKPAKKPAKKEGKGKLANSNNPVLRWIGNHKKATAGIGCGLVLLIIVCIWAFGIAPAVTITLKLETTTGNFSEGITFTQNLAEEKVEEGKFYIEEKKIESKAEVEFDATGKKNLGEKASGTLTVYYRFKEKGSIAVNAGSTFTYSNLGFVSTAAETISWGGKDSECKNKDDDNIGTEGCYIYKDISVQATESGANYNISATGSGWVTNSGVTVASGTAMAGGSDKTVTVVQQSDIDEAMKKLATENESANKDKLLESIGEDNFAIESSFKQETGEAVSTPKVGEQVEDGKKAKLSVTTTDTIFVMDETKLKEFITAKAKLQEGYKIYEMKDPFIENFLKSEAGYVGKLKTSYTAGSTITENDVVDTVKGKGIGSAKRDLSDNFKGIKTINIDTSVPWVTSVPGNPEKITVIIKTEE